MIRHRSLRLRLLVPAAVLVAAGCGPAGARGFDDGTPVARSGPHVLTVREASDLLAGQPRLPAEPGVVRAVADLWVDYVLLARAVSRDTTLRAVNLEPVVRQQLEQELVLQLRDSVVRVDTTFTDEELRALWAEQAPGTRIHARHILLTFPGDASDAQRDSVLTLARELRERALAGEEFAALARRYSQDPGSAGRGGDLGTFGRGEMVPAFDEAAFALGEGEVSEPVESPYGVHVIRVGEKTQPAFEESRDSFAREVRERRTFEAESTFVSSLVDTARITVADGAVDLVRRLASRPGTPLPGRAARRPLAEYEDGRVTATDVREFLRAQNPGFRGRVERGSEANVESLLRDLVRRELLLREARARGHRVPEARRDSLLSRTRDQLTRVADELGLRRIEPREDESPAQAIDRAVIRVLEDVLANRTRVVHLGPLAYSLRREMGAEVYEPAVPRVLDRIAAARGDTATGPAEGEATGPPPGPADSAPPGDVPAAGETTLPDTTP